MKYFYQVDIISDPALNDEDAAFLWMFNPDGINFENNTTRLFFSELPDGVIDQLRSGMNDLLSSNIVEKFDISVTKELQKNWNEEWQKNLKVLKAGKHFAIKPTFVDYTPAENEIVIEIDPKMSFGTGEHETTRLILSLLEKHGHNREFVLDAGAGTAILAIAAVKLGSKMAIAFDNDDWCLENGIENVKLNNVEEQVEIRICETSDISENNFDLILANIQRDVLLMIAEELRKRQKPGGTLILSGLLMTDEEIILPFYEALGYRMVEKTGENEWISLVMELAV
ncbi:MAG: 50S ribosomal protein L11 methyltransferase [Ignavibacteria bacterium]|nr:50S ribosomal protein L11 methyltransferase [Ignavibacteria bacterium]